MDTKILRSLDNLPEDDSTRKITAQEAPPARSPKTVLIIFAESSKTLQFELDGVATVGRRSETGEQPDVDLAPFGAFPAGVSRIHARLHRTEGGVILEDLNARNGTFIEDKRLAPGQYLPVRNGQAIRFGGLHGWIYFEVQR